MLMLNSERTYCIVTYTLSKISFALDFSRITVIQISFIAWLKSKVISKFGKFPHSPILHYAFSSWIEKTMTKTNTLALGKQMSFTIVWSYAEILPSLEIQKPLKATLEYRNYFGEHHVQKWSRRFRCSSLQWPMVKKHCKILCTGE